MRFTGSRLTLTGVVNDSSTMTRAGFLRVAGAGAVALAGCGRRTATSPGGPPRMVRIPGGRYAIGGDDGPADERPAHTVKLAPFLIDRREVTNGQFVRFLNSLAVRPVRDAPPGEIDDEQSLIGVRRRRFAVSGNHADLPVAETSWRGARAFAEWRGARLPTEAEWEAAARGRAGRAYPWGDGPVTARRAVVGTGEPSPVGSRPAGATPKGLTDMAGNLAEWTSSLYRPYPYDPDDGREDADDPGERVTRGGDAYFSAPDDLRCAARTGFSRVPGRGHRHIGFRCARSA